MSKPQWTPPPNWPPAETGWTPPKGWQPPAEWGPAPAGWDFYPGQPAKGAAADQAWYRKAWALPVGALLLGLLIGSSGGSEDTGPTQAQLTAAQERVTAAEAKAAEADVRASKAAVGAGDAKTAALADLKAQTDKIAADRKALDVREAKVSTLETEAKNNEVPGSGIYLVGSDIQPGTYKAGPATSGNCYYARLTGAGGDIIENGNQAGPVVIVVRPKDGALELSGCETLRKVG